MKWRSAWISTFWGRLALLIAVLVLLWVGASSLWSDVARPLLIKHTMPEAWRQLHGEVPPLIAEREVRLRKANINGVPIAIPSNYLALVGIEYKDQSIWAPRKPETPRPDERTSEDPANAFTLSVRWPGLQPRGRETEKSYWNKDDPEGDAWLLIGLRAHSTPEAIERGWGPVLRGRIKMIEGRLNTRFLPPRNSTEISGGTEKVRIHYEMRGTDPETGLRWAEPVGPGDDRFHPWNQTLHWRGELDGHVSDLIACYNGRIPNPDIRPVCRHRFYLAEWSATIDVTYPLELLPQWQAVKSKVRDLILGFKAGPSDSMKESH
ncbi:hypothetical protein D5687_00300 [Guyparkeria sp. SCN-R1]|nr:hypothetical protein D5687_00300 [Guyparkeria sp. SCN-R1]